MLNYTTRGLILGLVLLMALFAGANVWAGGAQEAVDDHHDDHHHEDHDHDHDHDHDDHGAMSLPHIDPVDLGAGERLTVVATTSIVGDVVQNIAGDAAEVTVLMARGQNPHAYEPTPRAMARMNDAHVVFVNGLNLEENLMEALKGMDAGYVVPVSAGIEPRGGGHHHDHDDDHDDHDHDHEEDDHHHAAGDPHFWFAPTNVIVWAENIAEALSEADPRNHEAYEANADAYIAELEAIDREIRAGVAEIPRSRRKLVVDHAALGYFADEYGFEVVGAVIPSTTDQAEPSAQDIAGLVEVIREEDVRAIFVGGTAGRGLRNLVNTVAEEVGRDLPVVELLTGSLAPEGSRGDTYLEFARYNGEAITGALSR
jgi:ABC-type Zn uptake system ZnuABC Zn-binding protein ZnuA